MIQKIELRINTENTGMLGPRELINIQEILDAVISSGGFTGVRGGQTILHFDAQGIFQSVELDYHPWRRRKKEY